MKLRLCSLVFYMMIVTIGYAGQPSEVPEGGQLRDATLYGFAGDLQQLSQLRGKPLVINVWASWCGPCRAEMASLSQLAQQFNGKQFNIIGISTDDDADAALKFILQANLAFANYHDHQLIMETMLGASRIPLTVLIDAKGRIVKKIHGAREWDSPESLQLIGSALKVKI